MDLILRHIREAAQSAPESPAKAILARWLHNVRRVTYALEGRDE